MDCPHGQFDGCGSGAGRGLAARLAPDDAQADVVASLVRPISVGIGGPLRRIRGPQEVAAEAGDRQRVLRVVAVPERPDQLPNVAQHIVHALGVGRLGAHGVGLLLAVLCDPRHITHKTLLRRAGGRCERRLPLAVRRQPIAVGRPFHIQLGKRMRLGQRRTDAHFMQRLLELGVLIVDRLAAFELRQGVAPGGRVVQREVRDWLLEAVRQ